MRIGELAAAGGVTAKTIRYYESIGVLSEPARSSSGYRTYGAEAIDRLDFVKQGQAAGLSLAEIRSILAIKDAGGQSCEHTAALLEQRLVELDQRIGELHAARAELQAMYERAASLDPTGCTDPNRCQVLADST